MKDEGLLQMHSQEIQDKGQILAEDITIPGHDFAEQAIKSDEQTCESVSMISVFIHMPRLGKTVMMKFARKTKPSDLLIAAIQAAHVPKHCSADACLLYKGKPLQLGEKRARAIQIDENATLTLYLD